MKSKGLFNNTAKDFAAGLLVAAIFLFVIFAGFQLLANEMKPIRDFRASIERKEIDLGEQHILP